MESFVAVLGASQLGYLEAVETQQKADLIAASGGALDYIGGVPAAIVPDCLKSAVSKADLYEPDLNRAYAAFARHYGMVVLPARSGKPKDNVFIERLWRSLKYEAVYLHDLEHGFEAQRVIGGWMEFYKEQRPHSALAGRTPEEAYRDGAAKCEEEVA